tara:strand:+ start:6379 stop:6738 length:360 start_codon:yes stop_codon:yes gene_type:complete
MIDNKRLIVVGSGPGVKVYAKELIELNKNEEFEIMAYGLGYMYCVNELNFQPDYCIFVDPVPFVPIFDWVQRRLRNNITTKRPALPGSVDAKQYFEIMGSIASKDLDEDRVLLWEDLRR